MLGNLIGHRDRDTHTFLLVVLLVTHKPLPRLNGRMNTTLYGGSTRRANTGLCRRTVTSAWVRCIAMGDGTSRPGEDSPSLAPYTAPWQWGMAMVYCPACTHAKPDWIQESPMETYRRINVALGRPPEKLHRETV